MVLARDRLRDLPPAELTPEARVAQLHAIFTLVLRRQGKPAPRPPPADRAGALAYLREAREKLGPAIAEARRRLRAGDGHGE
jgi:hypothetical protein